MGQETEAPATVEEEEVPVEGLAEEEVRAEGSGEQLTHEEEDGHPCSRRQAARTFYSCCGNLHNYLII